MLLGIAAAAFSFSVAHVNADSNTLNLVSVDSVQLMQKSKEGQKITNEIQKKVEVFQDFYKKSQDEVTALTDEIKQKEKVWSADVLQSKKDKLAKLKKNFERNVADKQESLRAEIQRKQIQLRDKQLALTKKVFEDKKWGIMIDKNTPGVLCVANAIDKTNELLKIIDQEFDKSAKASSKKVSTKKKQIKAA